MDCLVDFQHSQVVFINHAPAVPLSKWESADVLRPLTEHGIEVAQRIGITLIGERLVTGTTGPHIMASPANRIMSTIAIALGDRSYRMMVLQSLYSPRYHWSSACHAAHRHCPIVEHTKAEQEAACRGATALWRVVRRKLSKKQPGHLIIGGHSIANSYMALLLADHWDLAGRQDILTTGLGPGAMIGVRKNAYVAIMLRG